MTVLSAVAKKCPSLFAAAPVLLISIIYLSISLFEDYSAGGDNWKQGDWLINSVNGPIRRSVTGDLFIWLSHLSGVDLLLITVLTQLLFSIALYILIFFLIYFDRSGALGIIALSPLFFVIFWLSNEPFSVRKELIAFVALAIIALSLKWGSLFNFLLGSILLTFSVAAHEALILLLPTYFSMLYISSNSIDRERLFYVICCLTATVSILLFGYSLSNAQVENSATVCQPLISLGLSEYICNGAIKWLEFNISQGVSSVDEKLTITFVTTFVIGYGVALVPPIFLSFICTNRVIALSVTLLSFLPFSPLYLFSVDYSRWVSLHIFSIFVLWASLIAAERVSLRREVSWRVTLPILILGSSFLIYQTVAKPILATI